MAVYQTIFSRHRIDCHFCSMFNHSRSPMQTCTPLECSWVGFRSQSTPAAPPSSLQAATQSCQDKGLLKVLKAVSCQMASMSDHPQTYSIYQNKQGLWDFHRSGLVTPGCLMKPSSMLMSWFFSNHSRHLVSILNIIKQMPCRCLVQIISCLKPIFFTLLP